MGDKPEEQARAEMDRLLTTAGWSVQVYEGVNQRSLRGIGQFVSELKHECGSALTIQNGIGPQNLRAGALT